MRASDLGGVEMHGTGTALGDPIEVGAIVAVQQVGITVICCDSRAAGAALRTSPTVCCLLAATLHCSQSLLLH